MMRGEDARTASALADTDRLTGAPCAACERALCGHEAVLSLVLGYKSAPHCLGCVAAHMREATTTLRERAFEYVRHHDCFLACWDRASEREGFAPDARPACLWRELATRVAQSRARPTESGEPTRCDAAWDAGDMGCGDLVLQLRLRLRELPAGAVLRVRATDAGAPADLPAWCGLTGHAMLAACHPDYWIRRKE